MNPKFFRYGKPKISCVCDGVWLKRYGHLRVKLCDDDVKRWVKTGDEFPHKYSVMSQPITDLDIMRIKREMILDNHIAVVKPFPLNRVRQLLSYSDGDDEVDRSLPPIVLIIVAILLWVVLSYYIK